MPSTDASGTVETGPVVVLVDTPTLLMKTQQIRITAVGPTISKPCPLGGPAIFRSLGVAGGNYVLPNPAVTFGTDFVHAAIDIGIPTIMPTGAGGCGDPFEAIAPSVAYDVTGVAFNTDGEPLSWTYAQHWEQVFGVPITPVPSTIVGPSHGNLGERAPDAWPPLILAVFPAAHSYTFQAAVMAWWSTEGDPELPPVDPPTIDFTPPPIPNCAGGTVQFGGQSVGTVPD